MRNLQLEYGAEIGRAIVNFEGPIVFCVISRYHGGAFVVFSKALNPRMTVLAVEGSFASVIGGAPAAAVVFAGEVEKRAAADPRRQALEARICRGAGSGAGAAAARAGRPQVDAAGREDQRGGREFDGVHNIHRAVEVGSVDAVIEAPDIRPRIIAEIEQGPPVAHAVAACRWSILLFGGRACRDHAAHSVVEPGRDHAAFGGRACRDHGALRWSSRRDHAAYRWSSLSRPRGASVVSRRRHRGRSRPRRERPEPAGRKSLSKIVSRTPVENPVSGV